MTEDPLTFELIPEAGGPLRLGRHVLHDVRSWAYDAAALLTVEQLAAEPRSVLHTQHVDPWNQGRIGSCTANAALGTLVCGSNFAAVQAMPKLHDGAVTEADAQDLYRAETRLDDRQIPGSWEPDDTGSTGLWSMKALQRNGIIDSYRHAFSVRTVLRLIQLTPISIGVTWYQSMFTPDQRGVIPVNPTSGVAGGHQVALIGSDVDRQAVRMRNSWGTGWGEDGCAWLSWDDLHLLLHSGGDAVVPVLAS